MAVIEQNSMPFKPYARLMNILGDQLITDKIVAVMEILKNCYDADSPSAEIHFNNIYNVGLNDLPKEEQACIEIRDEGCGMTLQTIKEIWLRPATPDKFDKKAQNHGTTPRGRTIQGEKGIGRFAIHKLGSKIEVYTKAKGENEVKLEMDFSEYEPEDGNLFNQNITHKLLEDVQNTWYVNSPAEKITRESGTIIKIYNLREQWGDKDYKTLYKNIQRLMPPVDENAVRLGIDFKKDFNVSMFVDGKPSSSEEATTFNDVINHAQYSMIGSIDKNGIINFTYKSTNPQRSIERTFNLLDKTAMATHNYSLVGVKRFTNNEAAPRMPQCGPFSFTFYAFDLKNQDKTILNNDLKNFIKENFVYVLRDGVRVYPYGENGIDWLNLDKLRSTYKAGQFVSYNDLTGFVYISQEGNPLLKDASNRQGIVNTRGAYDDFTSLVTAATEVFNAEIKIDKAKLEIQQKEVSSHRNDALITSYNNLQKALLKIEDGKVLELAKKFVSVYRNHQQILEDRLKTVEDLAGLGMAVEKSSHDTLRLIILMRENIRNTIKTLTKGECGQDELLQLLSGLDENLSLIYDDMQIIMPLFKVQRKAVKEVSVLECIKKVTQYFRYELDNKIETKVEPIGSDFCVLTNTGLILQVLINLVDNAIYWLNESDCEYKKIYFHIDSINRTLIVADNGKGIREDIVQLIFDEFVSMKSNGRGLGLYIARELLARINASIYVVENDRDKVLPGANFIIKFNEEEI